MISDKFIEMRWHGRGGQGAVTSAELVALAAIAEGKFAQAFPSFGPERRGAPVLAFNRISAGEPVRIRAAVTAPDTVVILDPGLLRIVDVTSGLKENGTIVVNSAKSLVDIKAELGTKWRVAVVNASAIAREMLGVNIVNTTMLGALVKATDVVKLESLAEPIRERFGGRAENNFKACQKAYDETSIIEPATAICEPKRLPQIERLPSWRELLVGCIVAEPGSAKRYCTGDWRSQRPVWDQQKCVKCGVCYLFCPEGCINRTEEGYFEADYFYCKGCGICARECRPGAITMVEETQ